MRLVTRSALGWPATKAANASCKMGLVIHYDGPGRHLTEKTHDICLDYWQQTRRYHMDVRGWLDIGYSYGVCPHAYVFEGRGAGKQQAAQPGGNNTYISCSLMLGDLEKPSLAQIEATRELRKWLMEHHHNAGVVKGHKDFIITSCPGKTLYEMVRAGTFSHYPKTKNVDPWDSRDATRKIQERLNKLGYQPRLEVDNDYGPKTTKAVKWFQRNHPPLVVDGEARGPHTWKALFG